MAAPSSGYWDGGLYVRCNKEKVCAAKFDYDMFDAIFYIFVSKQLLTQIMFTVP